MPPGNRTDGRESAMAQLHKVSSCDHKSLEGIIKHDLRLVPTNQRKFSAFMEYGQLAPMTAFLVLQPGFGPTVRVSPLKANVFGEYRAGDEIHVNSVIVEQHQVILDSWATASLPGRREEARWLALVKKATLIIESVILHELVHWGDSKAGDGESDGEARRLGWRDVGHMFVSAAYGDQFAIERQRFGRRLKGQKLDIEGWLGWDTEVVDGKRVTWPYDPWWGRGPGSAPPSPP